MGYILATVPSHSGEECGDPLAPARPFWTGNAGPRIIGGNGRTLHHRRSRRRALPAQPPGSRRPGHPGGRAPADLRPLLDLSRPRFGDPRARRLPHPPRGRASGPVRARPRGQGARVPQHVPASRHHGVPRARRQPDAVRLPLSRLDLRSWRRAHPGAGRGVLWSRLRQGRFRARRGAGAGRLSRLPLRPFRRRSRAARGLPRGCQGVSRPGRRPVAVRAARNRRRHPGIRHPRQLEAAGREQLRRPTTCTRRMRPISNT